MQRFQKFINAGVLAAEFSHVFCCVLPSIFSLISLAVTLGVVTAMPVFMISLHDLFHDWEVPVIAGSGAMIALGWGLHYASLRLDCRSNGCAHEPCKPVKKRASKILVIASALFVINVSVYTLFHRSDALDAIAEDSVHDHSHEALNHPHG